MRHCSQHIYDFISAQIGSGIVSILYDMFVNTFIVFKQCELLENSAYYILLIFGKPCRRNTCLLSLSVRTWTRRIYKNKKHTMVYAGFWKPFISPDCCWTASFSPVWSLVWCTFCVVGMFYSVVSHLIYKWINNRFRALTEIPRGRKTKNYLKCLSGQKANKAFKFRWGLCCSDRRKLSNATNCVMESSSPFIYPN